MQRSINGGSAASPRGRALALWTVLAAQLMLQMDFLIVIVALPRIQQDLGFSQAALSWVPNAFGLVFGGLLLLGGRLGDMMGQVRAFKTGLAVFVLASLAGGLAQSPTVLIAARVVQGIGAALSGPSVLALVLVMARNDNERAKGMSLFIAVSSVGASAGLMLGGLLTQFLSWRWSLLINVPVGVIVIMMIGRIVTETHPKRARLDIGGAITATLGSAALVYGFISTADAGWLALGPVASFLAAGALFALFFRTERLHRAPLLNLSLLKDRRRLGGLTVMALIVGMHFSVVFMMVQYLQEVLGWSPLFAGLAYLPLTGTVFGITHFVPRLMEVLGAQRLLIVGSLTVTISFLGFSLLDDDSSYFPAVFLPLLVHAVGIALVFAPGTVSIMEGVPEEHAGAAPGYCRWTNRSGARLASP